MKERCYKVEDKSYRNYGARGIYICEEWRASFDAFYEWAIDNGWQEGLKIDRIDNDGPYSPENCRWVDDRISNRNTRRNTLFEWNGTMVTSREIYENLEPRPVISEQTFHARLLAGRGLMDSAYAPKGKRRTKKEMQIN